MNPTTSDAEVLNWRSLPEFDHHEFVIALTDEASGLKAFVALHNRNLGMAHGGTRMKVYTSETEALQDALNLSRAMSYKSALAGLPYGGGKAVIILDESTDRQAVLKAYAEKITALGGLFHTGTDVGLTDDDVRFMASYCGYMLGVSHTDTGGLSTSNAAALGVYNAIKAAVAHEFGDSNLAGKTIGVKGLGKLGGELVHLLAADGVQLLISDADSDKVAEFQARYPNAVVKDPDQIQTEVMDIYAPCALGHEFTHESVDGLQTRIICGGANNQLADESVGDSIAERGIIYVPDYVANAGGLIFVSEELEQDGFSVDRIRQRLENIGQTVTHILDEARREGIATHLVAVEHAKRRMSGAEAL